MSDSELVLTYVEICKLSEDQTMYPSFLREWDRFKDDVKAVYPRFAEDNYIIRKMGKVKERLAAYNNVLFQFKLKSKEWQKELVELNKKYHAMRDAILSMAESHGNFCKKNKRIADLGKMCPWLLYL